MSEIQMAKLPMKLRSDLARALRRIPAGLSGDLTAPLTAGWPDDLRDSVEFQARILLYKQVVNLAAEWEPQPGFEHPLLILIDNAAELVHGSTLANDFDELRKQLVTALSEGGNGG